jgi:26S proteasome regulatory subunit N7
MKVLKSDEVNQQLFNDSEIYNYAKCFYDCEYRQFFELLAAMENRLKADWILAPHCKHYIRSMRVAAYRQFLQPYRSVTLDYMAKEFGVTPDYIDRELHKFIADGQLQAKIDKVTGLVETNQVDSKNLQYQSAIKHGDILLNRVQKLARVINT